MRYLRLCLLIAWLVFSVVRVENEYIVSILECRDGWRYDKNVGLCTTSVMGDPLWLPPDGVEINMSREEYRLFLKAVRTGLMRNITIDY